MMSGHGVEVSDWLATSMSNGTAMKLWNPNLVPSAMPSKPWPRAWASVDAKNTIFLVCSFVWRYFLIYLRSVPHCMDVCLVFACLAMCILANHDHV